MMSSWTDVEEGGSWWFMLEPVVETTEEELLFDTSPALLSKLLIRRCHIGVLKENLLSAKQLPKPC